ncbi:uncharacterized protein isoform X2 [Musca autumnalis]|uniref:uncharacterized protein isoform X2 n=1 Tax=Musca autumnalis TaxID=221902 RepID=UPI003CF9877A
MSAKMNNFPTTAATTETLPKSGHVNEVCKEWLVREDGALAYKLQSQEITDFYKGNRIRNAVVREDFPTALQEQIKEKETAEKQAEAYRRKLKEQEEYDKRVAKEIAEKLERDLQEQRLRELESERIAQDMQAIYVNLPPVPPPSARDKNKKLSPEKYDSLVGNNLQQQQQQGAVAKDRQLQEHADDIELYVDPCDYKELKEIGLPITEIKEINAKMKQEQKDELLARRLQEMEVSDGMSLEERDRMLAIEAQDKELAKMLQERERAKAKRAKEKARQRKSQQGKEPQPHLSNGLTHNGVHFPHADNLVMQTSTSSAAARHSHMSSIDSNHQQQYHHQQQQQQQDHEEDPLDLEAYSSPIDVLKHAQRTQNGCLTNGSLQRDIVSQQARHASLAKEDDIYTLPVDSCRPGPAPLSTSTSLRPASMNVCGETVQTNGVHSSGGYSQNSMTRSENFSIHSHDSVNSRHSSTSKTQAFDQNSSPTPPYMPIQGTRRSNSSEDRKKKSKDNKCTHQ